MRLQSSVSVTAEKLVELTAKVASRMHVDDEEFERLVSIGLLEIAKASVVATASQVVQDSNGLLFCKLCSKGPFTKKGMFLHLTRLHRGEIKTILESEIRNRLKGFTKT
ncbi:MAG: hypothetical protein ACP5HQ_05185 [Thermoprotei archaeon]